MFDWFWVRYYNYKSNRQIDRDINALSDRLFSAIEESGYGAFVKITAAREVYAALERWDRGEE